ncbi:hypothetical protein ABMB67_004358 [Halalkalibacter oceani]
MSNYHKKLLVLIWMGVGSTLLTCLFSTILILSSRRILSKLNQLATIPLQGR